MADKTEGLSYRRALWGRTFADWKPTRDRLIWGVVTGVLGFLIAVYVGNKMTPPQIPLAAGAIGAVGGVVIAALLWFLWCRYRTPAKIWGEDQKRIGDLQHQLRKQGHYNRLEVVVERLRLRFGRASRATPDLRFDLAKKHIEALESEVASGDFSRAVEVLALPKLLPEIVSGVRRGTDINSLTEKIHELNLAVENRLFAEADEDSPHSTAS